MTIESKKEKKHSSDEFVEPTQGQKSPALTVVFQTWSTPIVGIVMLVAGLFGGYYGRQIISPNTSLPAGEEIDPVISSYSPPTAPTSSEDLAAIQQEFMVAVVEKTRHFRGEPDAPVTIIEFSDFL
jgi:hypothetical protein